MLETWGQLFDLYMQPFFHLQSRMESVHLLFGNYENTGVDVYVKMVPIFVSVFLYLSLFPLFIHKSLAVITLVFKYI